MGPRTPLAARPVDAPRLGKGLETMRLLLAVDHGLQTASKRMQRRLGITASQRLVLRIAGRFPGISAGGIARLMHVDASTLTGVLHRLEERGCLVRHEDPGDRRRSLVELTALGLEYDGLRAGTVEAAIRRALARVTPEQLEGAETLLVALAEELERET